MQVWCNEEVAIRLMSRGPAMYVYFGPVVDCHRTNWRAAFRNRVCGAARWPATGSRGGPSAGAATAVINVAAPTVPLIRIRAQAANVPPVPESAACGSWSAHRNWTNGPCRPAGYWPRPKKPLRTCRRQTVSRLGKHSCAAQPRRCSPPAQSPRRPEASWQRSYRRRGCGLGRSRTVATFAHLLAN